MDFKDMYFQSDGKPPSDSNECIMAQLYFNTFGEVIPPVTETMPDELLRQLYCDHFAQEPPAADTLPSTTVLLQRLLLIDESSKATKPK